MAGALLDGGYVDTGGVGRFTSLLQRALIVPYRMAPGTISKAGHGLTICGYGHRKSIAIYSASAPFAFFRPNLVRRREDGDIRLPCKHRDNMTTLSDV